MPNFEVKIRDYQSLTSADLAFEPGLNVIVGTNNAGKTAIFRCIDAVLFNRTDDPVRFGADASLAAVAYRGHKVLWKRLKSASGGESKTVYQVDGETFRKVGSKPLPQIKELLSIHEIRTVNLAMALNFWYQEEPPFLVKCSPSKIFEFVSMSSEEGNLSEVVKDMRAELKSLTAHVQEATGGVDALTAMVNESQERLVRFEGWEAAFQEVISSESKANRFSVLEGLYLQAESLQETIGSYQSLVVSAASYMDKQALPLKKAEVLFQSQKRLTGFVASLEGIQGRIENSEATLSGLAEEEARLDLSGLEGLFRQAQERAARKKQLSDLLQQVEKALLQVGKSEEAITSLTLQEGSVRQELEAFDVCPLCEQPFKKGEEHGDVSGEVSSPQREAEEDRDGQDSGSNAVGVLSAAVSGSDGADEGGVRRRNTRKSKGTPGRDGSGAVGTVGNAGEDFGGL